MAHLLKRVTTEPSTPLRIMVQDKVNGDLLNSGGTFYFAPAGQDGDQVEVSELVARVVMTDPSLAVHFSCSPEVPGLEAKQPAASNEAAEPAKTRRRRPSNDAAE